MTINTIPVESSIVYLTPTFRQWLITRYAEIADAERELGRPEFEFYARAQVDRLERENDLTLAEMLDGVA